MATCHFLMDDEGLRAVFSVVRVWVGLGCELQPHSEPRPPLCTLFLARFLGICHFIETQPLLVEQALVAERLSSTVENCFPTCPGRKQEAGKPFGFRFFCPIP